MGLWGIVGKAAFSLTCAVGEAVLTTGGEAIKGGTKIYDDYQKGKKANLAERIVETTCSALGAGIVAGVKDMSQSASDIYADYQKEQAEEARRRAEEKARERQEYERQQGRTSVVSVLVFFPSRLAFVNLSRSSEAFMK